MHLPSNRWQCKHPACGRNNGVGDKWGDCINLVATLDNCSFLEAGKKLERWFPNKSPAPSLGESREDGNVKLPPPHHKLDHTSPSDNVKGYMAEVDAWFDALFKRAEGESDDAYRKRLLNGIKGRSIESYRAGQRMKVA